MRWACESQWGQMAADLSPQNLLDFVNGQCCVKRTQVDKQFVPLLYLKKAVSVCLCVCKSHVLLFHNLTISAVTLI